MEKQGSRGMFRTEHPQVAHLYDIKHKTALLLKKELEADSRWEKFVTKCNKTRRSIIQTELAFLNPPVLKTKARYMNLESLVSWGENVLRYLENPRDFPDQPRVDRKKLREKLSWLREYQAALADWSELLELAGKAEDFVRKEGYHQGAKRKLRSRLKSLATAESSQRMKENISLLFRVRIQDLLQLYLT